MNNVDKQSGNNFTKGTPWPHSKEKSFFLGRSYLQKIDFVAL